jgi:chorismate mutase
MKVKAVRGAVSIDTESGQSMTEKVGFLVSELLRINSISLNDIISIQFTQTADLNEKNAAAALRESSGNYSSVPLFCASEPDVKGSLSGIVRVLVTWQDDSENTVKPVYLDKAAMLRLDLQ